MSKTSSQLGAAAGVVMGKNNAATDQKHLYIYIYIYICMYVYIYIYTYMYVCIYIYIYVYVCVYIYIYIHMYVYIYIYICIYVTVCLYYYMYSTYVLYVLHVFLCILLYYRGWHHATCCQRRGSAPKRGRHSTISFSPNASVQWQSDGSTIHTDKWFLRAGFLGAPPIYLILCYAMIR